MKTVVWVLVLVTLAVPAYADVFFATGNNPQTDENVLFNGTGLIDHGTTVQGELNQSHLVVDFTAVPLENLNTPSSGQARIVADDGLFTGVMIQLHEPGTFESIIFNIDANADGSVVFTAINQLGNTVISPTLPLDGNGENFFTITTDAAQSLKKLTITTSSPDQNIVDLEQVRIGGATGPDAVPLPSTALSALALLVPLSAGRWIRRR